MLQEGYKAVTIRDDVYERAAAEARTMGISMSGFVERAIESCVRRRGELNEIAELVARRLSKEIPRLGGEERQNRRTITPDETTVASSEESHLRGKPEHIRELYTSLKERILKLGDDVRIEPLKWFIFLKAPKNFGWLKVQKTKMLLFLNLQSGRLDDPEKRARTGHYWGNANYQMNIESPKDIDYATQLIRQSYQEHRSS